MIHMRRLLPISALIVLSACTGDLSPGTTEPAGERPMAYAGAISRRAAERGLLCRALWECTTLSPPLCITREEVDEIVSILRDSVEEG